MKMIKLSVVSAILAVASTTSAFAADATLNFTGNIIQPSCTVDSTSTNQTIDLGTAKTTDFAAVGSTNSPTAFNLNLKNCAAGTIVTMNVAGTMDTVTSVLKNTGTATFVGVQLLKGCQRRRDDRSDGRAVLSAGHDDGGHRDRDGELYV
ncbi:fimbrial protein [Candidatus Burkholderia verschuerenii]|uniref:fimbrial protein n=1 Tax=Candidatus Burkholderia verschuerenii TaxID=242163 RepID=UPI00067AECBF|nr:fimbrial protein [Candidatus Burkholderia verschuerenii]